MLKRTDRSRIEVSSLRSPAVEKGQYNFRREGGCVPPRRRAARQSNARPAHEYLSRLQQVATKEERIYSVWFR